MMNEIVWAQDHNGECSNGLGGSEEEAGMFQWIGETLVDECAILNDEEEFCVDVVVHKGPQICLSTLRVWDWKTWFVCLLFLAQDSHFEGTQASLYL
ncbi:hypothetical protein Fmac_005117 [Flemingia macrophylla]|uniref:Uncharacterized protein n=1 Tax=Flemingia macrophylla TaxID=520843 RepID=A0ABD1N7W1_9FABA